MEKTQKNIRLNCKSTQILVPTNERNQSCERRGFVDNFKFGGK